MLTLENITRAFDSTPVLHGVSLEVQAGEIMCLLGASGSGKSTLLRIIAGLERPDSGDVLLHGRSIVNVPVHERGFGLMFQDFALFPHLNVQENVRFGLRTRKGANSREGQLERVRDVIDLVGLRGFERRDVTQLSGGEKQRVSLARSLAPNPTLLLLDEPLGSLDAALRERLITDVRDVIKAAAITAVYVTHDQREAFAAADRIAVMHDGRIEQVATPQTLYQRPLSVYVARFLGLNNIITRENAVTPLVYLFYNSHAPTLLLHPDGLTLADNSPFTGQIVENTFAGDSFRVTTVHENGVKLSFNVPSASRTDLTIGTVVGVNVDPVWVIPLERSLVHPGQDL